MMVCTIKICFSYFILIVWLDLAERMPREEAEIVFERVKAVGK